MRHAGQTHEVCGDGNLQCGPPEAEIGNPMWNLKRDALGRMQISQDNVGAKWCVKALNGVTFGNLAAYDAFNACL